MKQLFVTLLLLISTGFVATAQNNVGINNPNPAASAALMVDTTAAGGPQGILVPRMTQARRNAIAAPATGLMVFQTDNTPGFYYYNGTAWTTVGGGATLPSQSGNAGKVLTTDGSNLSWGSGVGASYEVYATITTAQTTSVGSSLVLPDAVYFSSNTSPAVLTGGNDFSNVTVTSPYTSTANAGQTASRFTAVTAGLYFVDIQLIGGPTYGASASPIPMLDYNGIGTSASTSAGTVAGTNYYGIGYNNASNVLQTGAKTRGVLQRLLYMNANDYFIVRVASSASVAGVDFATNGSSYIKIIKLR